MDAKAPMAGAHMGPAQARYEELVEFRRPFLERARECAELTIPALIPPEGWTGSEKLYTPYQGIGARGLNNLASKLILILFPPNSPFFRYRIAEAIIAKLSQDEDAKTKIEEGLARREREITIEIESSAMRVPAFEGLKHLICGGNVLLNLPPTGSLRVFHLDRYVVKRDPSGNVLEIVTKEDVSPSALPEAVYKALEEAREAEGTDERKGDYKTCGLYTHIKRSGKLFNVYQEVKGIRIPGSEGSYPVSKLPWLALRFTRIDGEDYGRGYIEEYLGDLKSLESLSETLVEGAAAAAKVLFLVAANGTTRMKDLAEAKTGDIRQGNAADVTVLQVEKFNDFRVASDMALKIEQRLSFAFLMNTAIQREGERVTAEEIRYMARELEDALGGVYSILSQELQLPIVIITERRMERKKLLEPLPKGMVRPVITTGLEALGRGHDASKLDAFLSTAAKLLGPEAVAQWLVVPDALQRIATSFGIDSKGLVKTLDQVAQETQQAQQQALMSQLGPNAVNQIGNLSKQAMQNQQQAPPAQQ